MSFNAKDMTQGGQIASMRIRMFSQIANIMLYCLFIFFWILVGRKRKLTAVCSHQTRIGNLDAHLI
ncbi:hypothetical protein [Escherichia coli]|uniref:hypothetical protein n=1 Tax=Escherichia coli TaxID=562 RepID=UPI0001C06563|nr:hypothetical protein [Escherichia coli]BAI57924.1 truncated TraD [Escherichia coli SE15]